MFTIVSDNTSLTKEKILSLISQEQIFEFVFGPLPKENEFICSPFREDDEHPGCYFEYDQNNVLRFIDFANTQFINGIDCRFLDCFNAVQLYFNLSFYEALEFIHTNIIKGEIKKVDKSAQIKNIKNKKKNNRKSIIVFKPRIWKVYDDNYWKQFAIRIKILKKFFVYPVEQFYLLNTRKGDIHIQAHKYCYAYTDFSSGNIELYQPYAKKGKFFSTCTNNDIIGANYFDYSKRYMILTKSFKDWLILKGLGLNVLAFMNEGMVPDIEILTPFLKNISVLYIFFDNDKPGKTATVRVKKFFNLNFNHVKIIEIFSPYSDAKDAADIVKKRGVKCLKEKLKNDFKRKPNKN